MKRRFQVILLKTGMFAVLIYILHILLGGLLWKDYSQLQQPISDLTANNAPDRTLLLYFTNAYGILALLFAFSFTVFESRKYNRIVFFGGISFIIMHIVSISYSFFPQELPGNVMTFTGKMHLVITALIVPFTILSPVLIGLGMRKNIESKKLGNFSFFSGIMIIILGGLTGIFYANNLSYFGLVERLNIGTLQFWTFILSYKISTKKVRRPNINLPVTSDRVLRPNRKLICIKIKYFGKIE